MSTKLPDEPLNEFRQWLVESNMAFVQWAANRICAHIIHVTRQQRKEIYDLCVMKMIRAAQCYDPRKGFKFTTYASWWILRSGMEEYMRQKIKDEHAGFGSSTLSFDYGNDDEQTGSSSDATENYGSSVTMGQAVEQMRRRHGLTPHAGDCSRAVEEADTLRLIRKHCATERDYVMLWQKYGLEMSLREISIAHGVSRERVRQIIGDAEDRLHRVNGLREKLLG